MTLDLLTDHERTDLERLVRATLGEEPEPGSSSAIETALDEFEQVYVEGRVAGLCHDGALELVQDALAVRGVPPGPRRP